MRRGSSFADFAGINHLTGILPSRDNKGELVSATL